MATSELKNSIGFRFDNFCFRHIFTITHFAAPRAAEEQCHHTARNKRASRALNWPAVSDYLDPIFAADAAFSVGDLNAHIKRVLQADPILCDIAVAGEISNFKHHSSGHCYFSIKDEGA